MALKKILIVDDSKLMHGMYDAFLSRYRSLGTGLCHAMDGIEALEALQAHPDVGLILLDRYMPGMDGLTLLSRLKTDGRFKDIPVIMLTSEGRSERVSECPKDWIEAYITKPVHPKELHACIRRLFPEVPR